MTICNIRIATTEALLAKGHLLFAWQVPIPVLPLYNSHSQKVTLADGGQARRGFSSVSLTWEGLTVLQARTIIKLAEDAVNGSGLLYATVNRAWNGAGYNEDWIDVSGRPHIPDRVSAGRTRGLLSESLTLFLNNLTIEADPSAYV